MVDLMEYGCGQPVGVKAVETPEALMSSSRSGSPRGIGFGSAPFDLGIGPLDQAFEQADIGGIHSVKRLLGEATEQDIHLLVATVRRAPKRPAAAHSRSLPDMIMVSEPEGLVRASALASVKRGPVQGTLVSNGRAIDFPPPWGEDRGEGNQTCPKLLTRLAEGADLSCRERRGGQIRPPESPCDPSFSPLFGTARSLKGVGPRVEGLLNKLLAPSPSVARASD